MTTGCHKARKVTLMVTITLSHYYNPKITHHSTTANITHHTFNHYNITLLAAGARAASTDLTKLTPEVAWIMVKRRRLTAPRTTTQAQRPKA
eukprot:COSAG02_NODE_1114_length_14502_cov_140.830035_2_plen_92_part_00